MNATTTPYRRKLIEVALPLDAINKESAREKEPFTRNHPRSLHIWWARRPLVACRAVLFAQMVDDPSSLPEEFPSEEAQEGERQRLFHIIEELVKWENTINEAVLHAARVEIARTAARNHGVSLPHSMTPAEVADALKRLAPPMLDPFAGGGSIPLEAQRLGLEAHASDLNPVAVLINKALIEIPPKFAGRPPVNPVSRKRYLARDWKGTQGLAEDVRYYGQWIRDEAFRRIGHLYPKAHLPHEHGDGEGTVIAWLWARTVTCPNPACGVQMPLLTSLTLSSKKGREAYLVPHVEGRLIKFSVSNQPPQGFGSPSAGMKRGTSGTFECVVCGTVTSRDYVAAEGKAKRLGVVQTAIVVESRKGKVYLPPSSSPVLADAIHVSTAGLTAEFAPNPRDVWCRNFGFSTPADLFSPRQLLALSSLTDLTLEAREHVLSETGADLAYAEAVATYLAMAVSRWADLSNAGSSWNSTNQNIRALFSKQAIGVTWDFVEVNPFGSVGALDSFFDSSAQILEVLPATPAGACHVGNASADAVVNTRAVVTTDPPYYGNITYSDVSDFFYVWLRRALQSMYPDLFETVLVPKASELVAAPYRFSGDSSKAKQFFEAGLEKAFHQIRLTQDLDYPSALFYAFKQSESETEVDAINQSRLKTASTGWETMLQGLVRAGFTISGTWPIRTERGARTISIGTNALASSIVLVCRPRSENAPLTTRREFLNALKRELPAALKELQRDNIAPVDLAQAAIGPGMAVFSRYSKVLESDGSQMRVRTALQLINQTLDEVLAEQEGEFDADTRWAVAWFEQYGMQEGPFGVAETLSKAKNTAVGALAEAGILEARGGKVRLLGRDELPENWNPHQDHRLSVWKVTQHLIRAVMQSGVSSGEASALLDAVGSEYGDKARDLAYRLYTTSERRKWTQEALAYNTLVTEWHDIAGGVEQIRERERTTMRQHKLIEE